MFATQQGDPDFLANHPLLRLPFLCQLRSITRKPGICEIEKHGSEAPVGFMRTPTQCSHQFVLSGLELFEYSVHPGVVVELSR